MGIKAHSLYTAADYQYLRGKGYTDAQIKAIWDRDAGQGAQQGQQHTGKWWEGQ